MRAVAVIHHDERVGTVQMADSVRAPLSPDELAHLQAVSRLFFRSTSWLYQPRDGDFRFELREVDGKHEEVVVIAHRSLGPGDLGAIDGFVFDDPSRQARAEEDNAFARAFLVRRQAAQADTGSRP